MARNNIIEYLNRIDFLLKYKSSSFLKKLYNQLLKDLKYKIDISSGIYEDNMPDLIYAIKEHFNIPGDYHLVRSRKNKRALGRQILATIIKNNTDWSLQKIGLKLGYGHATILHSLKTIDNYYDTNIKFIDNFNLFLKANNLKYTKYSNK